MRERLEDLEEGGDLHNCECETDPPRPGYVIISVFCHDCGGYMSHIGGDIDRQVKQLAAVQHIIHVAAAIDAREAARRQARHAREDDTDTAVTMTEVYGDDGFRPFG